MLAHDKCNYILYTKEMTGDTADKCRQHSLNDNLSVLLSWWQWATSEFQSQIKFCCLVRCLLFICFRPLPFSWTYLSNSIQLLSFRFTPSPYLCSQERQSADKRCDDSCHRRILICNTVFHRCVCSCTDVNPFTGLWDVSKRAEKAWLDKKCFTKTFFLSLWFWFKSQHV